MLGGIAILFFCITLFCVVGRYELIDVESALRRNEKAGSTPPHSCPICRNSLSFRFYSSIGRGPFLCLHCCSWLILKRKDFKFRFPDWQGKLLLASNLVYLAYLAFLDIQFFLVMQTNRTVALAHVSQLLLVMSIEFVFLYLISRYRYLSSEYHVYYEYEDRYRPPIQV